MIVVTWDSAISGTGLEREFFFVTDFASSATSVLARRAVCPIVIAVLKMSTTSLAESNMFVLPISKSRSTSPRERVFLHKYGKMH